ILLDLAAGRIVLRHEADPRRQMPAVLEQRSIGDTGPERTGDHRTNRGDRLEARPQLARLVLLAQRGVERGNFGTDRLDLSYKHNQGCTCRHGQPPVSLVWNTFFARSSPMLVIVVMDGSSLVIRHQRSLYGTSMPSEAPSTSSRTVLAAASDECQLTSRFLTNPCTAQAGRSGPRKHFNLDLDFRNAHRDFPLLI